MTVEQRKPVDLTERLARSRLKARREALQKGLTFPTKPSYDAPRLPTRLTERTDAEVMRALADFTRYQDFLATQLWEAEVNEHDLERHLEIAKARHLAKNWSGTSTDRVAIAKAEATLDEDVVAYEDELAVLRAKRKLYSILVENMQRDAAVISREISRRIGREPAERRSDRFSP